MNKFAIFALIAASFCAVLGFSSNAAVNKNGSADVRLNKDPIPIPTNVETLELAQSVIYKHCQIGYVPTESCPDETTIYVSVNG